MTALVVDRPAITDREFARIIDELTRRGFLAGGLGSAALLGLAACGSEDPGGKQPPGPAAARWSFTDDLGRTVRLDQTPRRIVVLSDPLAGQLWSQGLHTITGAPLNLSGDDYHLLDADGVTAADRTRMIKVGGANSADINIEAVAKAAPELIIASTDSVKNSIVTRFPALAKIAPWIGVNAQTASFENSMASGARLLRALHVQETDLAAKAGYDAQAARLRSALAAKPTLRIGFVLGTDATGITLMGAGTWPCLLTLSALGADLAKISGANPYFQQVSWENVATLPLDFVVYTDGNGGTPDPTQPPWSQPTWQQMPAIKAGQYLNSGDDWFVYNYATFSRLLADLTDAVGKATADSGHR